MRGSVRPGRSLRALLAFLIAGWLLAALVVPVWAQAEEEKAGLAHHDEAVDEAIERGLAYLADKQDDDGSFPSGWGKNTGITSLCVMAFLAKGYTPGDHEYGQVIDKGLDFVLASRKPNDMLVGPGASHGPMYGHTISTLMLSEVSGMVDPERQKAISEVLPKALRVILAAQQVPKLERYQGERPGSGPPGHRGEPPPPLRRLLPLSTLLRSGGGPLHGAARHVRFRPVVGVRRVRHVVRRRVLALLGSPGHPIPQ